MNRTHLTVCAVVACTSPVFADNPAKSVLMRPGQYEMTSQIEMPAQVVKMPPRKDSACVTAEDLKDWSKNVAKTPDGVTCKLAEYIQNGNQLNYVRECTNKNGGHTTFKGAITFTPPDTYQAVVNLNNSSTAANPVSRGITITISAHRTRECAK